MQSNFLKSDDKVELTGPNTEKYLCEIQVSTSKNKPGLTPGINSHLSLTFLRI